ncbi:hypothetical protein G6F22_015406 [Rhizopus arrhizus]|nr:hypothetical protein G6F22_015406 [Rhizopus arrhizus]
MAAISRRSACVSSASCCCAYAGVIASAPRHARLSTATRIASSPDEHSHHVPGAHACATLASRCRCWKCRYCVDDTGQPARGRQQNDDTVLPAPMSTPSRPRCQRGGDRSGLGNKQGANPAVVLGLDWNQGAMLDVSHDSDVTKNRCCAGGCARLGR